MSHRPERKEKDCLNCGTIVQGRYCQVCGQENLEPKETFWGMCMHFLEDITHFDGKFFTTLKVLITRPGFLSAEYMRGRRASYLNPVRMYVFTSFLFFLVFFSMNDREKGIKFNDDEPFTLAERKKELKDLKRDYRKDTLNEKYLSKVAMLKDTTKAVKPSDLLMGESNFNVISSIGRDYKSMKEYDSIQKALPASEKDGWLKRIWNKKSVSLEEKYRHSSSKEGLKDVVQTFLHNLPIMLFVSLPFFALILKLLYVRRKQFYYADHGIFTIHHYVFSFILLLVVFIFDKLIEISGWGIWDFLLGITLLAWPVYLYIEMKKFYKQGRFKTFIKFLLLNLLGLISLVFLFAVFGLFSIFQM